MGDWGGGVAQTFAIQDGGTLPACPQHVFSGSMGRCVGGWGEVFCRGGVPRL